MTRGPSPGAGAAPSDHPLEDGRPDDGAWALLGLAGHPVSRTPPDPGVVAAARRLLEAPEPPGGPGSGPATAAPSTAQLLPALGALVAPALARHRRLGLPDDVARATLADAGRKVRAYGEDVEAAWFLGLLRADVVAVDRLQVERVAGARGRALHVPEGAPLDAPAVRDAVDRADALLGPAATTCTTWLLDPWLRTALPPGSGILRFAALFRLDEEPRPPRGGEPTSGDRAVARFVFRRPLEQLLAPGAVDDATLQRTSLQRLTLARLRAGEHWLEPCGTYAAPP